MTDTATTTTSTTIAQATIDAYFESWNSTDPTARAAAIERAFAPTAHMADPLVDVTGHDELAAVFAQFHDTYAGHTFRQVGGVDGHHGLARWGWEMIDPAGQVALAGIDIAVVADDGRLARVAGFFGGTVPDA
jgi:hypothetical protein